MTLDTVRFDPVRLDNLRPDQVRPDQVRPDQVLHDAHDDRVRLLLQGVRLGRTGPADQRSWSAPEHLVQHVDRVGSRPRGSAGLVDVLDRAGLTGCGGAHVSTATRWRAARHSGGPLVVVANGAESEPLSAKDATLLSQRPHLVLDGLALAAETLGAVRAVLWLHAGDGARGPRSSRPSPSGGGQVPGSCLLRSWSDRTTT